jgi:hypothetical protein
MNDRCVETNQYGEQCTVTIGRHTNGFHMTPRGVCWLAKPDLCGMDMGKGLFCRRDLGHGGEHRLQGFVTFVPPAEFMDHCVEDVNERPCLLWTGHDGHHVNGAMEQRPSTRDFCLTGECKRDRQHHGAHRIKCVTLASEPTVPLSVDKDSPEKKDRRTLERANELLWQVRLTDYPPALQKELVEVRSAMKEMLYPPLSSDVPISGRHKK